MAHAEMRDRLVAIASANSGDPAGFLEDLSDVHDDWHSEFVRSYGFLLFHHRVVRYFQAIVNVQLEPRVVAYTGDDLQGMEVQPFAGNVANVDTLGELAGLSSSIESWHNTAHGGLANATGTPMMDPRRNIMFRPFWRLHLYIDGFFVRVLDQYGDRTHAGQFITPDAVASHIEVSHHGWVPRI
jgi:hypothetical protein